MFDIVIYNDDPTIAPLIIWQPSSKRIGFMFK